MTHSLTPEERAETFGEFDPGAHRAEAEQRWGDTDAYRESNRRTSGYTKVDWLRIKAEAAAIHERLAAGLAAGVPAGDSQAMDLAEAHRQHLTRWFYDCSYEFHRKLGEMYVADPRFTEHYEAVAPGLAAYLRDAINANARAH